MVRCALSIAAIVSVCGAASASTPRALLTNQAGNPLTTIPGTSVPVSSFTQAQIGLSPLGTRWTIVINATSQPSAFDTFLLGGTAQGVTTVVQEGVVMGSTGFSFAARPNAQVAVNDAGDLAFKVTLNAPAATNDAVMSYNAALNDFSVIAREGSAIPNVPGEVYGPLMDSTSILNDGRVAWRARSTTGALPSDRDDFIFLSGSPQTSRLQTGTLVPSNQLNGGTARLTDLNDEAYISGDGSRLLVDGVLSDQSRAIIVDERVVMQVGAPITGLGGELPASGLVDEARVFSGGDWAAWGVGAGGTAFALVNDGLYVKEGDAIPGGLTNETLTSIEYMHINSLGDIAYAARTTANRTVIIVDGVNLEPYIAVTTSFQPIGITSGTQVDYNGDGIIDDAHFTFFNDDTLALSDAGELYFVGRVTSGATNLNLGDGLFVVQTLIPAPGSAAALVLVSMLAMGRRRR